MGSDDNAAQARAQLAQFGQWMEEHKIQGLICERQSIKSEKKNSKKDRLNAPVDAVSLPHNQYIGFSLTILAPG